MFEFLKNLFKSPKALIGVAVDSLDLLVPTLAHEIEKIQNVFDQLTALEKAQWLIDKVQEFLRNRFHLNA